MKRGHDGETKDGDKEEGQIDVQQWRQLRLELQESEARCRRRAVELEQLWTAHLKLRDELNDVRDELNDANEQRTANKPQPSDAAVAVQAPAHPRAAEKIALVLR